MHEYRDNAIGTMVETADSGGHFTEVTLYPSIIIRDESMTEKAMELHKAANKFCYIANSCNFPIHHKPIIKTQDV